MENLIVTPYFKNLKIVISEMLESAENSIDIAMCWMTSERMSKALLNFSNTSLDFNKLADAGVDVRAYIGAGLMHHKYVVIDSKYTITGSLNWTNTGPNQNEENIMVVKGGLQNEVAME